MDGNESSNEIDNSPNSNPEGNEQGNSDKVNTSDESIQNNTGNNTTINNKNNADNNINNLKAIQKIIELERRGYDEKRERYIQDREGFIKEKIINLIRKLATNHSGTTEKYGGTLYDKKKIAEHLLTHQRHKIIDDKVVTSISTPNYY